LCYRPSSRGFPPSVPRPLSPLVSCRSRCRRPRFPHCSLASPWPGSPAHRECHGRVAASAKPSARARARTHAPVSKAEPSCLVAHACLTTSTKPQLPPPWHIAHTPAHVLVARPRFWPCQTKPTPTRAFLPSRPCRGRELCTAHVAFPTHLSPVLAARAPNPCAYTMLRIVVATMSRSPRCNQPQAALSSRCPYAALPAPL
jgi:hypothetical protein